MTFHYIKGKNDRIHVSYTGNLHHNSITYIIHHDGWRICSCYYLWLVLGVDRLHICFVIKSNVDHRRYQNEEKGEELKVPRSIIRLWASLLYYNSQVLIYAVLQFKQSCDTPALFHPRVKGESRRLFEHTIDFSELCVAPCHEARTTWRLFVFLNIHVRKKQNVNIKLI